MAKVIIWTDPGSGQQRIATPCGQLEGESEADWLARIAALVVPQGTSYAIQDKAADPPLRVPRSLVAIYNDLLALTAGQKTSVWADLMSGSPPKISLDVGANAGSLFVLWRLASNASLPAAAVTDFKVAAAAMYVQDQANYLVHPSFDSTINVAGDTLA